MKTQHALRFSNSMKSGSLQYCQSFKKEWKEWLWLSRGLKKTSTCSFHVAVPCYWFLSNSHIIYLLIENEANMQIFQLKCFLYSVSVCFKMSCLRRCYQALKRTYDLTRSFILNVVLKHHVRCVSLCYIHW